MNAATLFEFGSAPNSTQRMLCEAIETYCQRSGFDLQNFVTGEVTSAEMIGFISFVDGAITALQIVERPTQKEAAL